VFSPGHPTDRKPHPLIQKAAGKLKDRSLDWEKRAHLSEAGIDAPQRDTHEEEHNRCDARTGEVYHLAGREKQADAQRHRKRDHANVTFLEILTAIALSVTARIAGRLDIPFRAQTGQGSLPQLRALSTVVAMDVLVPGHRDTLILIDVPVLGAPSLHLELLGVSSQPRTRRQRVGFQARLLALGDLGGRVLHDDDGFRSRFPGTKWDFHIVHGAPVGERLV
jgi:hypothetical protein